MTERCAVCALQARQAPHRLAVAEIDPPRTAEQAMDWVNSGQGLAGIVPDSVGLFMVDVDEAGPAAVKAVVRRLGEPLAHAPTTGEGALHLAYRPVSSLQALVALHSPSATGHQSAHFVLKGPARIGAIPQGSCGKPVRLGPCADAWPADEISAWINIHPDTTPARTKDPVVATKVGFLLPFRV